MGYMRHHAIIVTCGIRSIAEDAHAKAREIFGATDPDTLNPGQGVSELMHSPVNLYHTFIVPPDGSKEGWDASDIADARRAEFIRWMDAQRYEDGSSSLKWAEIQYGDEDGHNTMLSHDGAP